jgi:hypothetical protein
LRVKFGAGMVFSGSAKVKVEERISTTQIDAR